MVPDDNILMLLFIFNSTEGEKAIMTCLHNILNSWLCITNYLRCEKFVTDNNISRWTNVYWKWTPGFFGNDISSKLINKQEVSNVSSRYIVQFAWIRTSVLQVGRFNKIFYYFVFYYYFFCTPKINTFCRFFDFFSAEYSITKIGNRYSDLRLSTRLTGYLLPSLI